MCVLTAGNSCASARPANPRAGAPSGWSRRHTVASACPADFTSISRIDSGARGCENWRVIEELPLNDDRRELKPGSKEWKRRELARYRKVLFERGGLYPPYMAAWMLGVSRQRVHQMFAAGILERLEFFGHVLAPGDELEALIAMEKERRNPAFRLSPKEA